MLRRAENCALNGRRTVFGKRVVVTFEIGRKVRQLGKIPRADWDNNREHQRSRPVHVVTLKERAYWRFQDRFYWDNDGLNDDEVYALLVTRAERERAKVNRATAIVAQGRRSDLPQRGAIPDDLKQFVFRRDGGRCRACGSAVELQFDHVIPVALGGASSAENLQVLCGPCNRRKGAGLTT